MTTKRERVEAVYRLERTDRVPFVPAIYEHKGRLTGRSPSEICRNPDYLYAALKRELELYDADMVVIGVDVYNVEAEALGCKVVYFPSSDDVPAIASPIITNADDFVRLHVPDPERDGRMPMYLQVAKAMAREQGSEIIIRGAVSGPYSMAAAIAGCERLAFACVEEPAIALRLLDFCAAVTIAFGKAFLAAGVEPIIFDSYATPRLASPRVFRQMVMPLYRDKIFPELKTAGGRLMPLIIGGDTTPVIAALIETGAPQLLCDYPASLRIFRDCCGSAGVPFRANVDARLVSGGTPASVRQQALDILQECRNHPGFLLGCGVAAYDTAPQNILAIRAAIDLAATSAR